MKEVKQIPLPRARDEQDLSVCIRAHDQNSFTSFTSFTKGDEAASPRPRPPGSGSRSGLRLFGSITYAWHGETRTATASAPDVRPPTLIIALHDEWVTVSRAVGGTELVAWEDIIALSGWSPIVVQRLNEPEANREKLCDLGHIATCASANSHRPYGHQPDSAHLDVCGGRHADEAAREEDRS